MKVKKAAFCSYYKTCRYLYGDLAMLKISSASCRYYYLPLIVATLQGRPRHSLPGRREAAQPRVRRRLGPDRRHPPRQGEDRSHRANRGRVYLFVFLNTKGSVKCCSNFHNIWRRCLLKRILLLELGDFLKSFVFIYIYIEFQFTK